MALKTSKGTIVGNLSGKNGMPTNVPGGGTAYDKSKYGTRATGQNLRDVGYYNTYYTGGGKSTATPKTTTSTRSTSGYSSNASANSGYDSGYDASAAYSALLAAYQKQQNDYEEYLRQQREAAQNAYNRGMNSLNSAYDSQLNSLNSNLSETKNQLLDQYNRSKNSINQDAENSLKQAYVNKMLSERNLGQQMSALGLNGGATETTLANMANNYGNARNAIANTQNNNLSNLEGNYSGNVSQAMQAYNSAVANANLQKAQQAMALENALANNEISALGDYQSLLQRDNENYLDLLKTAIANGASFSYNPTSANNTAKAVAVQQASNPTATNNLAAIQALMNAQDIPGTSTPGITVLNQATQNNPYLDILKQLLAQRA